MPGVSASQYIMSIGMHMRRKDKAQGSQREHDIYLKKIARQPGLYSGNVGRRTTAELMLNLLLRLNTIQNINTAPAITVQRADSLILQDTIQHAETQYRSYFIAQAIDREVRRTTTLDLKVRKNTPYPVVTTPTESMLTAQTGKTPYQRGINTTKSVLPQDVVFNNEKSRRSLPERLRVLTLTTESGLIKDDVRISELPRFVIKRYGSWNDVFVSIGKGGSKPFTSLMKISDELYNLFTGKAIDAETKKFWAGLEMPSMV
ncbi:hypothetical protein SC171_21755 [Pantoea cypripedii]|uniref:hypothetical protein n=1 Tax=Pantoea cypripedii TaxID=55209 RepID=UPI002FC67202